MILLTWPEVWVLAGQDGQGEQTADCIHSRAIRILWVWQDALQTDQYPHYLSVVNGNLPKGPQPQLVHHIPWWHSYLLKRPSQPSHEAGGHVPASGTGQTETQTLKMCALSQIDHIPGAHCLCPRCSNWWRKHKCYQKWPTPTTVPWSRASWGSLGTIASLSPQFAQIAWSLHVLTSGKNAGKRRVAITCDDRCQQSFDELKCLCTTVPILP